MKDYEIKISMFIDDELPEEEREELFRFLSENEAARKTLADYLKIKNRAKTYYAEMDGGTDDTKIIGAIFPPRAENKKYKLPFYFSAAAAVLLAFFLWFNAAEKSDALERYGELHTKYVSLQKEYINALNENIELAKTNENLSAEIEKAKVESVAAKRRPLPAKRKPPSKKKQNQPPERMFKARNAYAANVPVFPVTKDDFLGRQIIGN